MEPTTVARADQVCCRRRVCWHPAIPLLELQATPDEADTTLANTCGEVPRLQTGWCWLALPGTIGGRWQGHDLGFLLWRFYGARGSILEFQECEEKCRLKDIVCDSSQSCLDAKNRRDRSACKNSQTRKGADPPDGFRCSFTSSVLYTSHMAERSCS